MADIKILTPEIELDDTKLYLIRAITPDGKQEVMFVNTKNEAKLAVDSLAAKRCEELEDEWTKVYRTDDTKHGRKVVIATQSLGRLRDGAITEVETIDYIRVPHGILKKGRHELGDEDSESEEEEEVVETKEEEKEEVVETEEVVEQIVEPEVEEDYPSSSEDESSVSSETSEEYTDSD